MPPRLKLGTEHYPYLPKRMCECAIPKVLRASRRNGVLIIPKSARLLNPADVPQGAPWVSPPLSAQFLCWRKNLVEYPAYESRYCFSYLPGYYRGGVPKSYEGMKTPVCYEGQNLALPLPLPTNPAKIAGNG